MKHETIYELVGLKTEIMQSSNKQILGITGTVMNETKNMFLLKTKFGLKHIPKDCNVWKFFLNNNQIVINGNQLKSPYKRLEVNI